MDISVAKRRAAAKRKCPEPHAGSSIFKFNKASTGAVGLLSIVCLITGSNVVRIS